MRYLIIAVLILLQSGLCLAQDTMLERIKGEARVYINQVMKEKKITGLSVAVVRDGKIVWSEGFGMSDLEKGIACTDSTVYRVGSISKLFTATAIMQLVQEGKISLDAPVVDIIPEFSMQKNMYDLKEVTVRRLLTHKSGLPSDVFRGLFDPEPDPIDSIIAYLSMESLTNDPGTCWSYSNPGYTLLGYIVQRVSGQPFEQYMAEHVFSRMGMNHSSFTLNDANRSLFSAGFEKGKKEFEPVLFELPAGLLHSNVLDLSSFMIMAMNKGDFNGTEVLNESTMREMMTPQSVDNLLDFSNTMGLCWFIHGPNSEWGYAGGAAEHGGDTYVYHAQLTLLPGVNTGVVVLTNSAGGGSGSRKITKKMLELFVQNYNGLKAPEEKEHEIWFEKSKEELLVKTVGDYTLGPEILSIRKGKDKLITKQGGITLLLFPNNLNTFTPAIRMLGVIRIPLKKQQLFFKELNGSVYVVAIQGKDTMLMGSKINRLDIAEPWKTMIGEYEGQGVHDYTLFKKIRLSEDKGILKVAFEGWMDTRGKLAIQTINATEAMVVGMGRQTGSTLRIEGNDIIFSGIRYKKIVK